MSARIVVDPRILHGRPHVKGRRIAASMVLELLAEGISAEEICERWYPDLTVADVRACIAFANDCLAGDEIHVARR